MTDPQSLSALAADAKAWPFELARQVQARVEKHGMTGGAVIFETGYGPSGLPHLGTFGEVVRTTMVRNAFRVLTEDRYPTKLICVSDDMDGMRKVPPTVPNPDTLADYLQKPLTAVPDPFGEHESNGAHMNARLRAFLDGFGFDYEFASATDLYRTGRYDAMLLKALEKFDAIMDLMLPTLGAERRATYSPFLPISPSTGRVLYVPMIATDPDAGTITYQDEDGTQVTTPVTGGHVKLQWKPDFGMRWAALGVDFEMFGKDHQDNAKIYSRICRILGAEPPIQYVYELFLDEKGEKISKSKGNGISVEQWLTYAPPESLALFQYQKPRVAKRLYFDVIPKTVDEYLAHTASFENQPPDKRLENPAWHIHAGDPPQLNASISFALMLNLASAASAHDTDVLWGFIGRYVEGASPATHPILDRLAGYAVTYFQDFVAPNKTYRRAEPHEAGALKALGDQLTELEPDARDAEAIQQIVLDVGKAHGFDPLRTWFQALYQILLGQDQGPRFGSFVAIYGPRETAALIEQALCGALVTGSTK
ncbi:MAG: lysine--tRNA ligase [Maricaulaceae bacterium]